MQYRKLGNTGLKVSEISLGSWLTYGGYVGKDQAIRTIDKAYSLGINFFDTANVYSHGEAERIVGEALAKYPRSSYVLATKVRGPMGTLPNDQGLSRKHITEQCEASLRRLGVDYIDLYYCHYPDPDTSMEETLRAIDDLTRQGKILYAGVSNMSAAEIWRAVSITEQQRFHPIVANQPLYNIFARDIESEVIPLSRKHGIGQVVYSPLAQGVLTGKYASVTERLPASRSVTSEGSETVRSWLKEELLTKTKRLQGLASEFGLPLSSLALAWTLRLPEVSSAIVGASRPEQIEANAKASGIRLTAEQWAYVDRILSE
ncbi:aldo/keto reductase family protein [Cohnella lubricantis]|uniref:Aldo/keto reductase family protein n=1 Tax=Cohnella lubricantis TaxID=2163172 RepID=A0A841T8T1_9BACL|nr:aldo/keto reductase family protein [Cohnella lubricantis]MBB6677342.1 aldo/keto reductase family protein [Cohnella lubricantis]MBP2119006.1 aryl-alcohol dehydrogenase-like predicted oxidoreductase [Cohnella lubricantis]